MVLFLLFCLGEDWYALDAQAVVQVLPLARLKQIPQAPVGVAGLFVLHGKPVPVVDLCMLALGCPSRVVRSTRIILVHYPDRRGVPQVLGLLAERATETLRREPSDFIETGVRSDGTPYLGPIVQDARGPVQWIAVDKLLSDAARDVLFREAAAS
jgi:chemotaxis-related protein WspB